MGIILSLIILAGDGKEVKVKTDKPKVQIVCKDGTCRPVFKPRRFFRIFR